MACEMLPEFIKAKKVFHDFIIEYFTQRRNFYSQIKIRHFLIPEGDKHIYINQGIEEYPKPKQLESHTTFKVSEFYKLTPDEVIKKFDQMASEFGEQEMKGLIEEISSITQKIGNVVNGELSPELYFEMLKRVTMPFNKEGKMDNPFFIMHPNMLDKFKALIEKIETDEKLSKQYEEIIQTKRREWNDRENSRKLVD